MDYHQTNTILLEIIIESPIYKIRNRQVSKFFLDFLA